MLQDNQQMAAEDILISNPSFSPPLFPSQAKTCKKDQTRSVLNFFFFSKLEKMSS